MGVIVTEYTLDKDNRVTGIRLTNGSEVCVAMISVEEPDKYEYLSELSSDMTAVVSPVRMSLANTILAAHVHLGLIPPQNFEPIACDNAH